MQFDTKDNTVHCVDCNVSWDIYDSNYYCRCGHTFKASEVDQEIKAIIEVAKLVANELLRKQKIQKGIDDTTGRSVGAWIQDFLKGSGFNIGHAIGKIINIVMKIFGI